MNPFIRVPTKAGYVLVNAMQITSVFTNHGEDHASVKVLYDANPIRSTATLEEIESLLGLGGTVAVEDPSAEAETESPKKRKR